MVLFAHCGSELIHDAAVDARVFVFRLLRDQGEVDFVIFHARVFGKRHRGGNFHRRGRGQAAAEGHRAVIEQIAAYDGRAALLQIIGDARLIIAPF